MATRQKQRLQLFPDLQSCSVDDYEGQLQLEDVPAHQSSLAPELLAALSSLQQWQAALEAIQSAAVTLLRAKTRIPVAVALPHLLLQQRSQLDGTASQLAICVLLPKRISCVQAARNLAAQLRLGLGSGVRCCIGKAEPQRVSGVTFATYRWFLEYMSLTQHEPFDYIILDHAHSTSLELDSVVSRLGELLQSGGSGGGHSRQTRSQQRRGTRVVISSHSLPTDKLAQAFQPFLAGSEFELAGDEDDGVAAPAVYLNQLLEWARAQLPELVDEHFEQAILKEVQIQQAQYVNNDPDTPLQNKPPSFRDDFADIVARLAIGAVHAKGNTVLFVPALCDIEMLEEKVDELARLPGRNVKVSVEVLHSTMPIAAQVQAIAEDPAGRTLYLVTSIAEAGFQIPSVNCVIDTGMTLTRKRPTESDSLLQTAVSWISQAAAEDRARVAPGSVTPVVLRMYTRELHDLMGPLDVPEAGCMPAVTRLLWTRLFEPASPAQSNRKRGLSPTEQKAVAAGLLSEPDASLSPLGLLSLSLPVDPMLGRLLVCGLALGLLEEAIVMAAYLSVPDPYYNPSRAGLGSLQRFNDISLKIAIGKQRFGGEVGSELLGGLLLYVTLFLDVAPQRRMAVCWEHGVALKRAQLLDLVVRQLCDRLASVFPQVALEGDEKELSGAFIAKLWNTCGNVEQNSSVLQALRCVAFGFSHNNLLSGRYRTEEPTISATAQTHLTLADQRRSLVNESEDAVWKALQSLLQVQATDGAVKRVDPATFEFAASVVGQACRCQPPVKIHDFAPAAKKLLLLGSRNMTIVLDASAFQTVSDADEVVLKVKQQIRWRWSTKSDRVVVSNFMDFHSVWRSEMFAVATELGPLPPGHNFRGLMAKGFTYLPYPALTVAMMAMVFDTRVQDCVAFWADVPSSEHQVLSGRACAGVAVNTEAVGVIVGATCLPTDMLASLLASVAELRTRFLPNQLLDGIASKQRRDTVVCQRTHQLLQDVLLLSLAIDCIARFYSGSLDIDSQSQCTLSTEVFGDDDQEGSAARKQMFYAEVHAQQPLSEDYKPALPILARQQFDFDEATAVHHALRSRIHDQLSQGLFVHPIAIPLVRMLANVLSQLPSGFVSSPATTIPAPIAISRKKRGLLSTDVQSARVQVLSLAKICVEKCAVHTLKNAYHRLHNEELDDFMMIDMLTNVGYHVASAKDRHVITAADQADRDALRSRLLSALAELRQEAPEQRERQEQAIPEVLVQAVSQLAQEFTSDISIQSLTAAFYFLHAIELPGKIAARILAGGPSSAAAANASKRARVDESEEPQSWDANVSAQPKAPVIAFRPTAPTAITPEELEQRILSIVYSMSGLCTMSEFNERYQKMFKPSHPSEQTNKKIVLQTLQKFGIPLTPQGFVGGQKAERERYLQESGAVILQDKGFEQNVLDLAAEAPSGKLGTLIRLYQERFRPSHTVVSNKTVGDVLEKHGYFVNLTAGTYGP